MPIHRLRTRRDIVGLKAKTRLFDRPASFRVEILLTHVLGPRRRKSLERRLAFALSDCGCAAAAVGLVVVPLSLWLAGDYAPLPIWPNTVLYAFAAVAAAGVGKLIGLLISYRIAHGALDELILSSAPAPPFEDRPIHEGER